MLAVPVKVGHADRRVLVAKPRVGQRRQDRLAVVPAGPLAKVDAAVQLGHQPVGIQGLHTVLDEVPWVLAEVLRAMRPDQVAAAARKRKVKHVTRPVLRLRVDVDLLKILVPVSAPLVAQLLVVLPLVLILVVVLVACAVVVCVVPDRLFSKADHHHAFFSIVHAVWRDDQGHVSQVDVLDLAVPPVPAWARDAEARHGRLPLELQVGVEKHELSVRAKRSNHLFPRAVHKVLQGRVEGPVCKADHACALAGDRPDV